MHVQGITKVVLTITIVSLSVLGILYIPNPIGKKIYLRYFLKSKAIESSKYNGYLNIKDDAGCSMEDIFAPAIAKRYKSKTDKLGMIMCSPKDYDGIFGPAVDELITKFHKLPANFKNISDLSTKNILNDNIDPEGKYVISVRARVARNINNIPFRKVQNKEDAKNGEKIIVNALLELQGDLVGSYHQLKTLSNEEKETLIKEHVMFEEMKGSKLLVDSKIVKKYTPEGSGIFFNKEKTFIIWVNEEDHLRIISLEKGANIKSVFKRLSDGIRELGKYIEFSYNDNYGYLTSCPSNIGTGLRISIMAKLPNLSKDIKKLKELASKHDLQVRGLYGENSSVEKTDTFDISNAVRVGRDEVKLTNGLILGLKNIIEVEKELDKNNA